MKYIHFSVDDVICSCIYSAEKNESFEKNKMFQYFEHLHERYGFKVSLYIHNWETLCEKSFIFSELPFETGEWLRFGIHNQSSGKEFDECNYLEGMRQWNKFCSLFGEESKFVGLVDTIPRLHRFAGSREALLGMSGSQIVPAVGFLCEDDSRTSYFLTEEMDIQLKKNKIIYDRDSDLIFLKTDIRLDWFDRKFASSYSYKKPIFKKPYDELVYRERLGDFDKKSVVEIFTHEWQIYRNNHWTFRRRWIEDVCRFACDYGYEFCFGAEVLEKSQIMGN